MGVEVFTELITTVGFPIAAVIALGFFVWNIYKQSVTREEKLMAEITENRLVNEKAIETIAHYAEKIDVIQTDIKEIKSDITVIKSKQ